MHAGSDDGANEPTEKDPSNEPNRNSRGTVLLRLVSLARLIDEPAYEHASDQLRRNASFDLRGHLEGTVGLDKNTLDQFERFVQELFEQFGNDAARIDESITDTIQLSEGLERTCAHDPPQEDLFVLPDFFDAGAETVDDTYGKNQERTETIEEDAFDSNPPGSRFHKLESDRYRLLAIIKEGGQAVVYRAWDVELKGFVALKTIRSRRFFDDTPKNQMITCERFVQEALITRRLTHPSVIPIYALDHWTIKNKNPGLDHLPNGIPFLVLPYYPKGDLSSEIDKLHLAVDPNRLDPSLTDLQFRERIGSLVQVCRAVAHAHERGIIHRDIKPRNILLGHHGEVYLADWGIAKTLRNTPGAARDPESPDPSVRSGSEPTEWGYYGTSAYMSPEQANGEVHQQDQKTDTFLIGATVYTLAFGQPPFASPDPHESRRRAAHCEVNYSLPFPPSADDTLINICKKAMQPKKDDRYPSAMALAQDLERWLADQPIDVETRRRKAARFLKRHSRSLAAATLVSLIGTGGLIVANYRISEARDVAVSAEAATKIALAKAEESEKTAKKAQAEESVARQQAEKNLADVANLAVAMLNVVAQKLPAIPGMSKVRLEIAEDLADRLQNIAAEKDILKDKVIFGLWSRVEREAGNVARFIGDHRTSRSHYSQSLRISNDLTKNDPGNGQFQIDKATLLLDMAVWFELIGQYAQAENALNQSERIVASIQSVLKNPLLDELMFYLLIQKSALLGQLGRDDERLKVLDQIATLEKNWFANLKAVKPQQFKYYVLAKFERAAHHLRAENHDSALETYRAALAQLQEKRRQAEAANEKIEPDFLVLIADAHHGIAEALRAKGNPAMLDAVEHYSIAERAHDSLDREAAGALSYLDNHLQVIADMRRFERESGKKFPRLMDDETAQAKIDSLIAKSETPYLKTLRAQIRTESAFRAADPQVRKRLAKQAADELDSVIAKLPLRKDLQNDREKLDEVLAQ